LDESQSTPNKFSVSHPHLCGVHNGCQSHNGNGLLQVCHSKQPNNIFSLCLHLLHYKMSLCRLASTLIYELTTSHPKKNNIQTFIVDSRRQKHLFEMIMCGIIFNFFPHAILRYSNEVVYYSNRAVSDS